MTAEIYDRELIARMLEDCAGIGDSAWSEKALRDQAALLRAADNRDAAGVVPAWIATWMADREILPDDDGDGISEGALVEALNNHERELLNAIPKAPAAVPAGEAVAVCGTCNGVGMIGGHRGQTPDSFEQWAEDCPDCTPQPADGEAVEFVAVPDDYRNQASGYRAGWTDAMNAAPVQAAPQEGEAVAYARRLAQAMWQRHYRNGAPQWEPCKDLMGLLSQIDNMVSGLTLAANPSACELGAVRDDGKLLVRKSMVSHWIRSLNKICNGFPDYRCIAEHIHESMTAALQHRGDSRGGEG